jgi:hypothetical protein
MSPTPRPGDEEPRELWETKAVSGARNRPALMMILHIDAPRTGQRRSRLLKRRPMSSPPIQFGHAAARERTVVSLSDAHLVDDSGGSCVVEPAP